MYLPGELQLPWPKRGSKSWEKIMDHLVSNISALLSPNPLSLPITNQALFHMSRFWNMWEISVPPKSWGLWNSECWHYTSLTTVFKRFLIQRTITYFSASPILQTWIQMTLGYFQRSRSPQDKHSPIFKTICHRLPKGSCEGVLTVGHDWNMYQTFQVDYVECKSSDFVRKELHLIFLSH